MTPQDLQVLRQVAAGLKGRRVALLNPGPDVRATFLGAERARFLPSTRVERRFDVLVATNTLMKAPAPALTLDNLLACCEWLVLLEPVSRRRSEHTELGPDGDVTRVFAPGVEPPPVAAPGAFDLGAVGARLVAAKAYDGGANVFGPARHLVALLRGDHAGPIIRVDDYPTGVRPIAADLGPLHAVLRQIDSVGLPVGLGIVPAILTEPMGAFLRSLEHLVPMAHGFDHAYSEKSRVLIEAGDPGNQRGTVGGFNEFRGRPRRAIAAALSEGKRRLEAATGRPVTGYIPPCNEGDRATGKALVDAGYLYYYSEKKLPGCPLPMTASDFYGRSDQYDPARGEHVVTLHATWEVDVIEQGDAASLPKMVSHLRAQRRAAEETGQALAARLALR